MEHRRAPGHRRWYIPDCYLPDDNPDKGNFVSHESCCVLNVGKVDARCTLTFYFEDREPLRDIQITVGRERCWHVRFDRLEEIAGLSIPRDVPYGLWLESDHEVVVQHSRLDSRGGGLAYMTVMGYAED
ncbi:MAG TPA: sensory rhodopsin transducer [Chloroflexota bacterium]